MFRIRNEISEQAFAIFIPRILPNFLGLLLFFEYGAKRVDSCADISILAGHICSASKEL